MIMSSSTCMKKATHVGGIRKRGNKAPRGYFRYGGKGTIVHAIVPFFILNFPPIFTLTSAAAFSGAKM